MKLGETDPTKRRIGPLHAVDDDGNAVLGEDFSGPGELTISLHSSSFSAAGGTIVEIGSGYYYYEATEDEASTGPMVVVKISGVCQEFAIEEEIGVQVGGLIAGSPDTDVPIGPLRVVNGDGDPLDFAAFLLGGPTKEISINGAAWSAPSGIFGLPDSGYAYYFAPPAELASAGWIAVRVSPNFDGQVQEVVFRADIVDPRGPDDVAGPTTEVVTPIGEIDATDEIVIDVVDDFDLRYVAAFATLPGSNTRIAVFRRGAFEAGFSLASYVEPVDEDEGVRSRLHIKRDVPWPVGDVSITIDSVDTTGNLGD